MADTTARLPERDRHLWGLTAAPGIWMLHFLACYVTASVWCAKFAAPGGSLSGVRNAIFIYTAVALAGIAVVGWSGIRMRRHAGTNAALAADTPEARHRFLGLATSLLAGLSAVSIVMVALSTTFFQSCW